MKPCQWVVVSPPLHIPGLCPGSCPSEPQDWGLLTLQTDPTCSVEWNYSSQPGFCICPFLLACFSSLWLRKSLRVVSLAFRVSSIPAVFMSHMNIMRVHSIPLSGQLNILNTISININPWEIPFITSHYVDWIIVFYFSIPSVQLFIHLLVSLSNL